MDFQLFYYVEKKCVVKLFFNNVNLDKMLKVFNVMTDHTKLVLIPCITLY